MSAELRSKANLQRPMSELPRSGHSRQYVKRALCEGRDQCI